VLDGEFQKPQRGSQSKVQGNWDDVLRMNGTYRPPVNGPECSLGRVTQSPLRRTTRGTERRHRH